DVPRSLCLPPWPLSLQPQGQAPSSPTQRPRWSGHCKVGGNPEEAVDEAGENDDDDDDAEEDMDVPRSLCLPPWPLSLQPQGQAPSAPTQRPRWSGHCKVGGNPE
ncbi:unnamed protein product, partial [Polarella glacialis]